MREAVEQLRGRVNDARALVEYVRGRVNALGGHSRAGRANARDLG
ncbi:hypothetical protein OSJ77_10375 [Phyllobacterium sp. 0TCS1.6C]|nr:MULTISPECIES: hypothetical protein [unclassified Phyllobacterium]MCX8280597.1 hypothetical protein [Phyllobacterium sp. 0TCS1.6C]MCX8296442.1 hypothetical protein [Phyllobacterium sp. 0TCS1.6A]